jgi:hypothetical protein
MCQSNQTNDTGAETMDLSEAKPHIEHDQNTGDDDSHDTVAKELASIILTDIVDFRIGQFFIRKSFSQSSFHIGNVFVCEIFPTGDAQYQANRLISGISFCDLSSNQAVSQGFGGNLGSSLRLNGISGTHFIPEDSTPFELDIQFYASNK